MKLPVYEMYGVTINGKIDIRMTVTSEGGYYFPAYDKEMQIDDDNLLVYGTNHYGVYHFGIDNRRIPAPGGRYWRSRSSYVGWVLGVDLIDVVINGDVLGMKVESLRELLPEGYEITKNEDTCTFEVHRTDGKRGWFEIMVNGKYV